MITINTGGVDRLYVAVVTMHDHVMVDDARLTSMCNKDGKQCSLSELPQL